MRPIRLDLDGFASFRDPTTIDFTDADYFALVGPTGSGKSTVIDGMTFALYGSAPRWGREQSNQYALAPSANRATVRLVFDVGGQRYVIVRELRRSRVQIMQKACLLERYLDPQALGDPRAGEPTESLAADPKQVRVKVVELLGLDLDEFCTCVVLPQGEFATFLRATATERQRILLKLLGARHYDEIGKLAGQRATDAATRIAVLQSQLIELADATEEAEATARARELELAGLETVVRASASALDALNQESVSAAGRAALLRQEIEVLSTIAAPDGIATIDTQVRRAAAVYAEAVTAEVAAIEALEDKDEEQRSAPERVPLEATVRWHEERIDLLSRKDHLAAAAQFARTQREVGSEADRTAGSALEDARNAASAAAEATRTVQHAIDSLTSRINDVVAVRPPGDLDQLSADLANALVGRAQADDARAIAEQALTEAEAELEGLPEKSALAATLRTLDAACACRDSIASQTGQQTELTIRWEEAKRQLDVARQGRADAEHALELARTQASAAQLRPHLTVGQHCPVCDQTVAVLPNPTDRPELEQARASVAHARKDVDAAEAAQRALGEKRASLHAELNKLATDFRRFDADLAEALPDNPSGERRDLDADRATHADLQQRHTAAHQRVREARAADQVAQRDERRAADDLAGVEARTRRSWATLHRQQGRLAGEGAPDPGADLPEAWRQLRRWAETAAARLRSELSTIQEQEVAAAERSEAAEADLKLAHSARLEAAKALTSAVEADSGAQIANEGLLRRLNELAIALEGRPRLDDALAQLDELTRLDDSVRLARAAVDAAGEIRRRADTERTHSRTAAEKAHAALRAAREPLIPLGAPAIETSGLTEAWAALLDWVDSATTARRQALHKATTAAHEASMRIAEQLAALAALLTEHHLDPGDHGIRLDVTSTEGYSQVPTMVRLEQERARYQTSAVVRRRAEAARLRHNITRHTETREVSGELQGLMRSNRFPRWLADEAMDVLVAAASDSLLQLSGNQFDLTHEDGQFYVIDHADADLKRSVRTLSGGETFQASLALALALSEQLAALAAGGRTTLDSIFLDEGFGTLDPTALEIVAITLENLAQGDRMVGVVTHVGALADQIPVRYEVSRDSRTSAVERTGP